MFDHELPEFPKFQWLATCISLEALIFEGYRAMEYTIALYPVA